MLGAVAYYFH